MIMSVFKHVKSPVSVSLCVCVCVCPSVMTCSDPGSVEYSHRVITGSRFVVGSSVQYICNKGYFLSGSSLVTCYSRDVAEPKWSEQLPKCVRKSTDALVLLSCSATCWWTEALVLLSCSATCWWTDDLVLLSCSATCWCFAVFSDITANKGFGSIRSHPTLKLPLPFTW